MIRSGRIGAFNKDSRSITTVLILICPIVLSISLTSLSLISYVNLCSFMFDYRGGEIRLQHIFEDMSPKWAIRDIKRTEIEFSYKLQYYRVFVPIIVSCNDIIKEISGKYQVSFTGMI